MRLFCRDGRNRTFIGGFGDRSPAVERRPYRVDFTVISGGWRGKELGERDKISVFDFSNLGPIFFIAVEIGICLGNKDGHRFTGDAYFCPGNTGLLSELLFKNFGGVVAGVGSI